MIMAMIASSGLMVYIIANAPMSVMIAMKDIFGAVVGKFTDVKQIICDSAHEMAGFRVIEKAE